MQATAEHIYSEAIQLNPIDRAELIEKLFSSFLPDPNVEIELKWKQELTSRIKAYDDGKIPSDTMENVFKRLSQR